MNGRIQYGRLVLWFGVGLAFLFLAGNAAALPYAPGTTNRVTVPGVTDAAYMLYLPRAYDPSNPPPLMLYFDPGGYAMYGIERLVPACEAMGWALACAESLSNSSTHGANMAVREIMTHVRNLVPHDRRRFYFAGLSGGAWRAHTQSRTYWNEAAGLLVFGTWIGDYDDYTVFPARMAIARVNGLEDSSAISREPRDDPFYARSAVRVNSFHFDGGHEIGPTTSLVAAIQWLDADFQANGAAFIPADFEMEAASLLQAAQQALGVGDYTAALSNVVAILQVYPMSSVVRDAEQVFFQLFTDPARRAAATWTAASDAEAWEVSWLFMQRALQLGSTNEAQEAMALYDMSTLACPTNARSLAEYADRLVADTELRKTEWPRAAAMIDASLQNAPQHWRGHHAKAALYAALGNLPEAIAFYETAVGRMVTYGSNDQVAQIRTSTRSRIATYEVAMLDSPALPCIEDFENSLTNASTHLRRGWATLWGTTRIQTETVHNGLSALSLTGSPGIVFLNAAPATNAVVWVDAYIQPAAAAPDAVIPALPPWIPAAWHVDETGNIRALNGTNGTWQTLLPPASFRTGAWNRITAGLDFSNRTWRLRVNDVELASGLAFAHDTAVFTGLAFLHAGTNPMLVDTLSISFAEPAADRDLDGMPDFWETANALDPDDFTDRLADPDGDGIPNFEEYRHGLDPQSPDTLPPAYSSVNLFSEQFFGDPRFVHQPLPFRRNRWIGEVLLISRSNADLGLFSVQGSNGVFWGFSSTTSLSPPGNMVLQRDYSGSIRIPGPVNGTYRFEFNTDSAELHVRFLGLNDADGDGMADEWEEWYFDHPTAAGVSGNMAGDAYPLIEKYFGRIFPFSPQPYSHYDSISIAGSFNTWSTTSRPLQLVADHLWSGEYFSNTNREFKFVANGSWEVNWGDNNPASAIPPFRGTAEPDGANIQLHHASNSYHTFSFHDLTAAYACVPESADSDSDGMPDAWEIQYLGNTQYAATDDPDGDGRCNLEEYLAGTDPATADGEKARQYSAIQIAGSFNGWNTTATPMTYLGNHWWQLDIQLNTAANAEFKFTANGTWDISWGSASAAAKNIPAQEILARTGNNIRLGQTLNGQYRITFNDIFGAFTLEPLTGLAITGAGLQNDNQAMQLDWLGLQNRFYRVYLLPDLLTPTNRHLLGRYLATTPATNRILLPIPTNYTTGTFQIQLEPLGAALE